MARHPIKPKTSIIERIKTITLDDAESMIIFDEKSPIWKTKKIGGRATFVTLKPPPDASDTLIDEIKSKLYAEHGARVVHVHAKQKSLTVIAKEIYEQKEQIDPRKVVMTMLEEANTKDRDALRARLEAGLAQAGL